MPLESSAMGDTRSGRGPFLWFAGPGLSLRSVAVSAPTGIAPCIWLLELWLWEGEGPKCGCPDIRQGRAAVIR